MSSKDWSSSSNTNTFSAKMISPKKRHLNSMQGDRLDDDDERPNKKVKIKSMDNSLDDDSMERMQKLGNYSNAASKMMAKMGYKAGTGLGKSNQGRVDIVPASQQKGRRGLGLTIPSLDREIVVQWEDEKEPSAKETFEWMTQHTAEIPSQDELQDWIQESKRKLVIDDETLFCERTKLLTVLQCKSVFDDLEAREMRHARFRSNPYETIKGVIFLNRAAMKMANMDCVFDRMFTSPQGLSENELMYFADVCAGPGGFSEYVLWRRGWKAKGFGFTLKGDNDFKLHDFYAAHPELFETHYGVGGAEGTGDIMQTENIEEFQDFVMQNTDGKGVHVTMADGGFSVAGQENIQEILTKQLLLCQFATALGILRTGGNFICKTFDLFTPFSVGLIYLLRMAFDQVCLFKPVTSRPANSERYVVCKGYKDAEERRIYEYLLMVNDALNDLKVRDPDQDINEVVPFELISEDQDFHSYVKKYNEEICDEQCKALAKIHAYAKDRTLFESRQSEVRRECLLAWGIPLDKARHAPPKSSPGICFQQLTSHRDPQQLFFTSQLESENIQRLLDQVYCFKCYVTSAERKMLVALGGYRTYLWDLQRRRWVDLPSCHLPRDTILEVEVTQECRGDGKGQHRVEAVHIVDVLFLCGEDMRPRNYAERMHCASMFAKAVTRTSQPSKSVPIRAKSIYRFEEIEQIFSRMEMRKMKGLSRPSLCYSPPHCEESYVPTGISFVKICKDPWTVAFSRSQKRKYFFNSLTRQSVFECPPDFNASYEICSKSLVHWSFVEAEILETQQIQHNPRMVSRNQIEEFVKTRTS